MLAVPTLLATLLLLPLVGISASAGEAMPRVASMSTCADQVLIEIADPGQIVGLSAFARDPGISYHAEQAAAFPALDVSAERLLKLRPDIVFASVYLPPNMRERLERFGMKVVTLDLVDSIEGSNAQIMDIARAIGREARGRALVAKIDARLAEVEGEDYGGLTALQLQRRGFVTGSQTLLSDLLSRFRVVPAATKLGITDIGRVELETLLKLDPDIVVMDSPSRQAADQGVALLRHPALAEAFPAERRIVLPTSEIVCGGPSLVAAADTLAAGLRRVRDAREAR